MARIMATKLRRGRELPKRDEDSGASSKPRKSEGPRRTARVAPNRRLAETGPRRRRDPARRTGGRIRLPRARRRAATDDRGCREEGADPTRVPLPKVARAGGRFR